MKRTIKEVYALIKEKRDSAENEVKSVSVLDSRKVDKTLKMTNLLSTISAYSDILCLIESSQLLEEDKETQNKLKALEIIKEYGIDVYWLMKYDFIQYQYRTQSDIPEDKFNFVKEVLL